MNTQLQIQAFQANILFLTDQAAAYQALSISLQEQGFQCRLVVCILEAEKAIQEEAIDLLIIAGLSCDSGLNCVGDRVSRLRALNDGYLPVVFIGSGVTDQILEGFAEAEIDAVLVEPLNLRLLLIKIRALLRLRQLYRIEFEQRKQLQSYSQLMSLEQEVAAKIFNSVLKSHFLETTVLQAVISPMSMFNGDLVLAAKSPDDHLHVLLGDFTGHGLSASIAAKPTAEIFSGMTQKGFAIADIATEINRKLCEMLPVNIFLAATMLDLDPEARTLGLITCGLPEHFLVDYAAQSCKSIASVNIPLGISPDMAIHEQVYNLSGQECLFLLTDGAFDAQNSSGESFGRRRIVDAICEKNIDTIETLQARLAEHCGDLLQKDDITFVKLVCDVDNVPWRDVAVRAEQARHIEAVVWKYSMEFDISTLRAINPVPLMVNTVMEIQGLQAHRQAIFMIVSELFANALDHGLLGLDSDLKSTPEGFMQFYALKDERLKTCSEGNIRVLFEHRPTAEGGQLLIKVRDSGGGFNWQHLTRNLDENCSYCGRGVKLVQALCSSLRFEGSGNQVKAVFDWQR